MLRRKGWWAVSTAYDRLLDVLYDLKNDIALCPVCEKVLLKQYINPHIYRYHSREKRRDDLQV